MEDKYIGQIINGHEIIAKAGKRKDGHQLYEAKCLRCGKIRVLRITELKHILNDRCYHFNIVFSNRRIGKIFSRMLLRCYDKNDRDYRFWGAKGITICDEWLNDRKKFEDWALANGYADNLTIDRIDSSKPYSPDNCRWITASENCKWKSTTNVITVNGITDSGRGWSSRLGCSVNRVNRMICEKGLEETKEWILKQIA